MTEQNGGGTISGLRNYVTQQQLSLRYVLIACIAGFQFVTVTSVVLLVYFTMDRAILKQSEDLLDQHSEIIVERISNFFLPTLQAGEMLVELVESGMTDQTQTTTLERIFYGVLRTSPEISGLYFGRPDGTFVHVFQSDGSAELVTRWNDPQQPGTTVLVRDEGYRPIGRYRDDTDDYDPRRSTWYSLAADGRAPTWTNAYTFERTGKKGMTFASPVYRDNRLLGVFGIDIEAVKLRQILENTSFGKNVTMSLFTTTGNMIAHVSDHKMIEVEHIADLTGDVGQITQTLLARLETPEQGFAQQFPASSGEGRHDLMLANIQSLADHDLPWLIATIATREALSGGLRDNHLRALWAAIVLLAVLTLFAIPLANRIRQPVLNFAQQSREMLQGSTRDLSPGSLKVPYSELETTGKTLESQLWKRRNFEMQYDRTFNVSQRGMAWIDPTTMRFIRVNKHFCGLLRKPEGVLLTCGLDDVLSGDKTKILSVFREAVLSDKDFSIEADFVVDEHLAIPLRMTAFPMRDFDGRPDHIFAVFDNNEEEKQSAARLENFKRDVDRIGRINLMGQFAAGLAHELNQPLGALVHDVDSAKFVLNASELDRAEMADILNDIDSHAQRAGDIIRALRNMIERDDQIPHCFQLDDLLAQTLAIMKPEAIAYDVDFELSVYESFVIPGNRVQIAQVLVNLIRNAISALSTVDVTPKVIRLEAYEKDGSIVISVEDNGPGFPAHIKPFTQFETTNKGGLGLGLSISKSLVEANRGTISHVKPHQGGTRFEITLPGKVPERGGEQDE